MLKKHFSIVVSVFVLLLAGAVAWSTAGPGVAASNGPVDFNATTEINGVLSIPMVETAPTVDGKCGEEYNAAVVKTFLDGNGKEASVLLMHDGSYLYVCMKAQQGTFAERFGSLYLDPQGDGSTYDFAQKDDYALHVNVPGTTRSSYHGSGVADGYVADAGVDVFWDGAAATGAVGDVVEYSVSLGRFKFGDCEKLFGLAMYHHWFAAVGDDYGWPSNQWFDQPHTWQLAQLANAACTPVAEGEIAYVFRGNTEDAVSFYNLLTAQGYSVTLVPLANVLSTDFSIFRLIVIADDTGSLDEWGFPAISAAQVDQIKAGNQPMIGVGEGGYAFFGRWPQFIGWPNGWHGPDADLSQAAGAPAPYFTGIAGDPVTMYTDPVNTVAIYLGGAPVPADAFPIGLENPDTNHANLIQQGCHLLWGFSGNPYEMSGDGQAVFLNAVTYLTGWYNQCPEIPEPQPENCLKIDKTANPAAGTPVSPGDIIEYTITYTMSDDAACENPQEARLTDTIPYGTSFVPGSASDGISPASDGALTWVIHPAAGPQTKTFKVQVTENACYQHDTGAPGNIVNRATLIASVGPVDGPQTVVMLTSPDVSHPVECPPIRLPNEGPMYAEDEITIDPYPLFIGHPSKIQVRIQNASPVSQNLNVAFQTSPEKFGIGIPFGTFATDVVTIPAYGFAIAEATFTPGASGHYCIQIVITGGGLNAPLVTQRNIDVTEDLKPGVPDSLTFAVGNPTAATADISLVVINTCPGWSAVISDPASGVLAGMAPGEIRNAVLTVTPPNPVVLGSGCHIDVQGWIGNELIGGIRKLDVPPVHLPSDVVPSWEEREISFVPDPPVAGLPGKICVELQNPLSVTKTVTVTASVADFGAGIMFTPVATQVFTLPPNSFAKYCLDWTPAAGGTLHRCVLIALQQPGYQDMHSQRNVDIRRLLLADLADFNVPFVIGNADMVSHTLQLVPKLYGLNPNWKVNFVTPAGDPAPDVINPNTTVNLNMILIGLIQANAATAPSADGFGDVYQIEVAVLFDGQVIGGFTVQVAQERIYLPAVIR